MRHLNKLNRFIAFWTLLAFLLGTLPTLDAAPQMDETEFIVQMDKSIKKIIQFKDSNNCHKLLETMISLKGEVEKFTRQKINLDKMMARVLNEIQEKGGKLTTVELTEIRKIIRNKEKRLGHKAKYIASCLEHNLPYHSEEEKLHFITTANFAQNNNPEISIPNNRVIIGVSVALCGLFLSTIPISTCKQKGGYLKQLGVKWAVDEAKKRSEEEMLCDLEKLLI